MARYRKKPIIIEAISFDEFVQYGIDQGVPLYDGWPWSFTYKGHHITHEHGNFYWIPTLEGTMKFTRDDVLITGIKGEIYPCKREIFHATYELIDEAD